MFSRNVLSIAVISILCVGCDALPSHTQQKVTAQDLAQGQAEMKQLQALKAAQESEKSLGLTATADNFTEESPSGSKGALFKYDSTRGGCFNGTDQSGYNESGTQECSLLVKNEDASKAQTSLENAQLRGSLISLKSENLNFEKADLRNAEFLDENSMNSANLNGANLQDAKLGSGSFEKADFSDTCLIGANLKDADVAGANFKGAIYSEATKLPFSESVAASYGMILSSESTENQGACAVTDSAKQ